MVKQERAVRTRRILIESAAEIFDREGFVSASLTAISRRAGVSSGALHFHFANKAALAESVEQAAMERLRAVIEVPGPGGSGWLQYLVDVTHGLARGLTGDVVLRAGFEIGCDPNHVPRTDLRGQWQRRVEQVLWQAGQEGELRPGVLPQEAAVAVVAATVGLEVLGCQDTVWLSARTISRFWRLLLPTLASQEVLRTVTADGTFSVQPSE
jgi:AcrR family transcriptional regulator